MAARTSSPPPPLPAGARPCPLTHGALDSLAQPPCSPWLSELDVPEWRQGLAVDRLGWRWRKTLKRASTCDIAWVVGTREQAVDRAQDVVRGAAKNKSAINPGQRAPRLYSLSCKLYDPPT
jgi:hypothetical protein